MFAFYFTSFKGNNRKLKSVSGTKLLAAMDTHAKLVFVRNDLTALGSAYVTVLGVHTARLYPLVSCGIAYRMVASVAILCAKAGRLVPIMTESRLPLFTARLAYLCGRTCRRTP